MSDSAADRRWILNSPDKSVLSKLTCNFDGVVLSSTSGDVSSTTRFGFAALDPSLRR